MKRPTFWTRLLEILDGTAAEYAPAKRDEKHTRRQRGQSLVEMAFITPLLVLLFAGLIEIGWLANNYLNLLDITRYGARYATTLADDRSPLSWDDRSSYLPNEFIPTLYEMGYSSTDTDIITQEQFARRRVREQWALDFDTDPAVPPTSLLSSACSQPASFYDEVACRMLTSMPPMHTGAPATMNPYNGVDDIIVSAFALAMIDVPRDDAPNDTLERWTDPASRPIAAGVPQLVVAGRYPANANECQQAAGGGLQADLFDPRDPFDFNNNGRIDTRDAQRLSLDPSLYYLNDFDELEGYDAPAFAPDQIEKQVGFQWYGNHQIPNTGCIGSEWTISRVEQLLNLPGYGLNTDDERRMLPNQGVVLVEMYWEHEMLLQMPVLSPVFEAFSRDGRPDLYLWAVFPLPSISPYIEFDTP